VSPFVVVSFSLWALLFLGVMLVRSSFSCCSDLLEGGGLSFCYCVVLTVRYSLRLLKTLGSSRSCVVVTPKRGLYLWSHWLL